MTTPKRIGLIATGSELITGDILNLDGQLMAQSMLASGMTIGEHLVVDDQPNNITRALVFMLTHHDAVITSGGLGPTSDDITRLVISGVTSRAMTYNEASWNRIVERLSPRYAEIPESNKQQAYFPEGANIYPNAHGTADGCGLQLDNGKWIFMLPGPPRECLPMFHNHVMPSLLGHGFGSSTVLHRWRLMGIGEATMAEKIEAEIVAPYEVSVAYRAAYPYLDIKLTLNPNHPNEEIISKVQELVAPYLVTTESSNISTQLRQVLGGANFTVTILDHATKGALAGQLTTPENHHVLQFVYQETDLQADYSVEITGLDHFWHPQPNQHETTLTVVLTHNGHSETKTYSLYLRGQETINCAVEFISHQIYQAWFRSA